MDYICLFLGILFAVVGIAFAFGKAYNHLSAWKKMLEAEKEKIKIEPLCKNIGGMIALNGALFILRGACAGFSEAMFTYAIIVWMVLAGIDVIYISKSSRYKNQ
ncbi:MAG: DUF3784 domain-containing protein [Clostridiales bacterium]|nr:DUF3784 domain-containing protein [Clostridiales bacterium]